MNLSFIHCELRMDVAIIRVLILKEILYINYKTIRKIKMTDIYIYSDKTLQLTASGNKIFE